jgi:thiamine kinase-like enzyme
MAPHPHLSDIDRLSRKIVPGTGRVHIEPLSSGLFDETYRVERGGRAYALRVALPRSQVPGPDRFWEAQVLECAARSALAPPVLHADPERGVLLTGWVPGRSWTAEEAGRSANIPKVAAMLRRVHALRAPTPTRILSPMAWVDLYSAALAGSKRRGDPSLRSAAAARSAELGSLPRPEATLCHSDLHPMNLIEFEDSLLLLDWEYAHVSEPFWDLAGWSANNDLPGGSRHELLMSYLGTAPSPAERSRLELLIWLYDYVCLLWSGLYLSLRGDPAGDVSTRATQLDARLRVPAHYSV